MVYQIIYPWFLYYEAIFLFCIYIEEVNICNYIVAYGKKNVSEGEKGFIILFNVYITCMHCTSSIIIGICYVKTLTQCLTAFRCVNFTHTFQLCPNWTCMMIEFCTMVNISVEIICIDVHVCIKTDFLGV